MDYLDFGKTLIAAKPGDRTFCGYDEQARRIWIKRPCPPKTRIWHRLQRMIALCLRQPILGCTVSGGGAESLRQEGERLRAFKAMGFAVPDVLAVSDEMLVLSDGGPQLRAVLDKTEDENAQQAILLQTARALAALHRKGAVHGRPYLRDMTWHDGTVGFLDLEETPEQVMPIAAAQARDVWLFLGSAARFARKDGDKYTYDSDKLGTLYQAYIENADPQVLAELKDFVEFLSPIRRLCERRFLWTKIGTDARQAVVATRCIKERK